MILKKIIDYISAEIVFFSREVDAISPIKFASSWLRSRNLPDLVAGLPALAMILTLAPSAILLRFRAAPRPLLAIVVDASDAISKDNLEAADFFLKEAQTARLVNKDGLFEYAKLLALRERFDEALAIFYQLAPIDEVGYVPAQKIILNKLEFELSNLGTGDQSDTAIQKRGEALIAEMETRYRLILHANPKDLDANVKLAARFSRIGDPLAAAELLSRIVSDKPSMRIVYAQMLIDGGEVEKGKVQAKIITQHYSKKTDNAEQNEEDHSERCLMIAQAYLLLEQYESAATALITDTKLAKDDPRARTLLGNIFFEWSESIAENDSHSLARRVQLLHNALSLIPRDVRVMARIAEFSRLEGPEGQKARDDLREILANGTAPSLVHFILGLNAFENGDDSAAYRHWETAHHLNSETHFILNNFALLMARSRNPELNKSLDMINKAIKIAPSEPELYDSRGEIFLKLNRYPEAISDLLHALRSFPDRPDIHGRLADAYQKQGDPAMSTIHSKREQELLRKVEK